MQYSLISVVLILVSIFLIKKNKIKLFAIGILLIAISWNAVSILPYYIPNTKNEIKTKQSLKLTSINLLSNNTEVESVENYIISENPDVLVLMEYTPIWKRDLAPVLEKYPFKEVVARIGNFGIALYSKFEMKSTVDYFHLNHTPSIISNLKIEKLDFTIVATHPVPPMGQNEFLNRNRHLSTIVSRRASFSENFILVGDFNMSSFSNHFTELLQSDLEDSRIGFGLLPTWPAGFFVFQTTLDHCLVSNNLEVLERTTGPNIGSDHLPISVVIGVK
jgi:endonuclease/exonuclease/phosphatase (EEP) superfamily protein YafD